jgi:hypothetical protein
MLEDLVDEAAVGYIEMERRILRAARELAGAVGENRDWRKVLASQVGFEQRFDKENTGKSGPVNAIIAHVEQTSVRIGGTQVPSTTRTEGTQLFDVPSNHLTIVRI